MTVSRKVPMSGTEGNSPESAVRLRGMNAGWSAGIKQETLHQPSLQNVHLTACQHTFPQIHHKEIPEAESQDGLEHRTPKGLFLHLCYH